MSDEPAGTAANPIECMQVYYSECQHGCRAPRTERGQYYRIVAYLDNGGLCPECESKAVDAKRASRKTTR